MHPRIRKPLLQLARRSIQDPSASVVLNRYHEHFCTWNAERLGISREESVERFIRSSRSVRGGHRGSAFRVFAEVSHSVFEVFAGDTPSEVWEAYRLHEKVHFLRLLSYREPQWDNSHPVVAALGDTASVTIVDFGCGLAQYSVSLAEKLSADGREVKLLVADIPTLHLTFLAWLLARLGIDFEVRECTPEAPIPELLPCDVLIAREFLEHVHRPVEYLDAFDRVVKPGGVMIADLSDHRHEFMHVSPNLEAARRHVASLGYTPLGRPGIMQKLGAARERAPF
jgi:2-polyprenyl-3-methyl-5-hydroxy-6-metoxy-1,4-benzoquinol methylase